MESQSPNSKTFCIGYNKTGTTSLQATFAALGYVVGDQVEAERIYDTDYFSSEFDSLIQYCRESEFFQDVPFSLPKTFEVVDAAYPGSRFILTVRDSPDQWYESLVRFHSRLVGSTGPPSADQLRAFPYRRPGFVYDSVRRQFGTDDDDLYNAEILKRSYIEHNRRVIDYFSRRPQDLLVLNLADQCAVEIFCDFMKLDRTEFSAFPHENRTA